MATRIKETPILTGADARRFLRQISNPQQVSDAEKQRIKADYEALRSIATFE